MKNPKNSYAFSLVEVLAAVTIIGIITFIAIPNIIQIKQDGEDNLATARAEALNIAIASYVQAVGGATAEAGWSAAATPPARYNLISQYLAFAEPTLDEYMPTGYEAINWPPTISPPSGRIKAAKKTIESD